MSFSIIFDISRDHLDLRMGWCELFAERESAPAARYGFSREGMGAGILDLPGWSVAYAHVRQAEG